MTQNGVGGAGGAGKPCSISNGEEAPKSKGEGAGASYLVHQEFLETGGWRKTGGGMSQVS